jgi:hypothetical protein
VTNPVSLSSFYCMYDIPLLLDSYFVISHTIGPTDRLHPLSAPHLKKFPRIFTCKLCKNVTWRPRDCCLIPTGVGDFSVVQGSHTGSGVHAACNGYRG